ncbi:MAG: hypothetical protein N2322_04030, partial [Terrimicrobiaceae bacterium]|nr:hypothetical protein [Terrimicrobiaceae bacterium]
MEYQKRVDPEDFIFRDASQRRWSWVKRAGFCAGLGLLAGGGLFLQSLLEPARVEPVEPLSKLKAQLHAMSKEPPRAPREPDPVLARHLAASSGWKFHGQPQARSAVRAAYLPT